MTTELEQDINFYNKLITTSKDFSSFLKLVSEKKYNEIDLADTPRFITRSISPRNFGSVYYSIKESGSLNNIKNDSLRTQLVYYHETLSVTYNNVSQWHTDFVARNIEDYIVQKMPLTLNGKTQPNTIMQEMELNQLPSLVNFQIWNNKRFIKIAQKNIEASINLIEDINMELNK